MLYSIPWDENKSLKYKFDHDLCLEEDELRLNGVMTKTTLEKDSH